MNDDGATVDLLFYGIDNNWISLCFSFLYTIKHDCVISCKLADFGLSRSLSLNHPSDDSIGNEEPCLTDYVGTANRFLHTYDDLLRF